jgi:hypothetical protein
LLSSFTPDNSQSTSETQREKETHNSLCEDVTYQFQYLEPLEVKNQVYQQSEKEEVDGGEGH